MALNNDIYGQIAGALTGVVKQIKALRYYPPRHPALNNAAEECLRGFRPLLEDGRSLSLSIRKDGFLFDDHPVAKGNQVIGQLAMFCFARRIQYLTVLSDLKAKDLNHFVHYLNLDHQKIQLYGGIQALLEKARVTTIWANERDLDAILARKADMEEQPELPELDPVSVLEAASVESETQSSAEAISLQQLIERLEQEKVDEKFRHGLQELIPLLRINLNLENRLLILRGLLLLCRTATAAGSSANRRESARQALDQLMSGDLSGFLIEFLVDEKTGKQVRQTLVKILAFTRDKTSLPLMSRLAEEKQAGARKLLAEVLAKCGVAAEPALFDFLNDDRWYVSRNVIAILGEIRSQASLEYLPPFLQHEDLRVQRETIRTLTKIGGQAAVDILLRAAQSSDQDLCRQALLSLGAMRAESAVPVLCRLLQQSGWSQQIMDLKKDAIRALGEIRCKDALGDLLTIAKRKRLLRRRLNEELRIAAIHALGELGEHSVHEVLEAFTNEKSAAVARAAAKALKQIDKG